MSPDSQGFPILKKNGWIGWKNTKRTTNSVSVIKEKQQQRETVKKSDSEFWNNRKIIFNFVFIICKKKMDIVELIKSSYKDYGMIMTESWFEYISWEIKNSVSKFVGTKEKYKFSMKNQWIFGAFSEGFLMIFSSSTALKMHLFWSKFSIKG